MSNPIQNRPVAQATALALSAVVALLVLQQLVLPTPPVTDPHRLLEFVHTQGALVTAAAAIRWLALLAGAYVVTISLLTLALSIGRPTPRLLNALRSVTLPSLRWLLPTVVGLGAVTMPVAGATAGSARSLGAQGAARLATAPPTTSVGGTDDLVALPGPTTTGRGGGAGTATFSYEGPESSTSSGAHPSSARPATSEHVRASAPPSRRSEPSAATPPTTTGRPSADAPQRTTAPQLAEARPAQAVSPPRSTPARRVRPQTAERSTWTVQPGDHLWRIAQATLSARLGNAPDEAAIARYWRKLIEANRDRLVDPSNPDLILPGQVFVLPGS